MIASPDRPSTEAAERDLLTLQAQATRTLILTALVGASIWIISLALRVPRDILALWIMPAGLAATGLAGLWALQWSWRAGRVVLIGAGILAVSITTRYSPDLQTAYYLIVLVMAASAVFGPRGALLSTLVSSLTLLVAAWSRGFIPLPHVYFQVLAIAWVSHVIGWLVTRNLYTAVAWATQAQIDAQERLGALRSRRAELRQATDLLRVNQERMHYLNIRLEQARVAAEEAYRTKQHFVANVSHELRTPLNLITGFTEMMAFAPESYGGVQLPRSYRQDVMEVYRSSKHLVGLVEDVLALAQLESGHMLIKRDWLDISELIHEATETMRPLVEAKGLALAVEDGPLPHVFADSGRIRQILLNLLNNAYRYTAQGEIRVTAQRDGPDVLIEVADTGVGISTDDLPYIFQEFHKLSKEPSAQRSDGFGLGLSISQRLIKAHGGRLWAKSLLGEGTTFSLALPIQSDQNRNRPPTLIRTASAPRSSQTRAAVLAIAQEPDSHLGDALTDYEVIHATPENALGALQQCFPTMVLHNEQPSGDGLPHYLAPLLNASPTVPVISCHIPTRQDIAHRLRASRLLPKPIQRQNLLDAIDRLAEESPIETITIIDDDASMVRMLARALRSAPGHAYDVREACGGAEGVEELTSHVPDLVLLDLAMPQVSGYDVLEWIQGNPDMALTRVVLLSGIDLDTESSRVYDLAIHCQAGFSLIKSLDIIRSVVDATAPTSNAQE